MAENIDPLAGLSKPWQKFFKRFDEINDLKVSQWKEIHVLAYICSKYKEKYNQEYSVTIKGAPSKSPDMYLTKRIIASLGTTNMNTVKKYIDWIYDNKSKRAFRTLGFFLTQGFVNEFKIAIKKEKSEFTRSTKLPEAYKTISSELDVDVDTYGDLAFIKMSVDRNKDTESNYYILLQNLELLGLDVSRLKNIGD